MESKEIKIELLLATKGYFDSQNGLITLLLDVPYYILNELVRHKRFSYSVSSARAQSTERHLSYGCYIPDIFYQDQKGMESSNIPIEEQIEARSIYESVWQYCINASEKLAKLGIAKEQTNRILPTNKMIKMVMTGTEDAYSKMLKLRLHHSADKAMQLTAKMINHEIIFAQWNLSKEHIPMIKDDEVFKTREDKILTSMARLARTSYDKPKSGKNDIELGKKLIEMNHWSPAEHIAFYSESYYPSAICSKREDIWCQHSWANYRSLIE